MDGDDDVRLWLVERTYTDRDLVVLVYATPDGERYLQQERAAAIVRRGDSEVTAAIDADPERLKPTEDDETRERYATEAARMAEQNDPDDAV
ncbi:MULTISPECIES: hypothetical protein [Halorussus]|uniref:hypothetical protein n=1 Tax=Halorussus TaxID=1070314 RepID=UPI00209F6BD4|nr:hypothetical protein [Halorussus vallis]USZ74420.1 hypothetical protein NGM07_13305 [Halorussus vallis]